MDENGYRRTTLANREKMEGSSGFFGGTGANTSASTSFGVLVLVLDASTIPWAGAVGRGVGEMYGPFSGLGQSASAHTPSLGDRGEVGAAFRSH